MTDCILALGRTNGDGYVPVWREGRWWYAHRLAYTLLVRDLRDGEIVRHRCRNRRCVNPDHLLVGSVLDNVRDMARDGTLNRVARPRKLDAARVAVIKALLRCGQGVASLAYRPGPNGWSVGDQTIRDIRSGKTWGKVQPSQVDPGEFDPWA